MDYIYLGSILQEARNRAGLKQSEVAAKIDCTPANISSWERGKSKVDIDSFAKLCEIYDIDFAYTLNKVANRHEHSKNSFELDTNAISLIKKYRSLDKYGQEAVEKVLDVEYERCTNPNEASILELPISELKVSAGVGEWLDYERFDTIRIIDTPEARKADIVIEVDGDSMEPKFNDGDKVLVRLQPAVEVGEIGIFTMDNQGYIKQYADDRLISLNPDYDDIYPSEYSDTRCIGKVIGKAIEAE